LAAGEERRNMNELALFAGAGGGILGGHLLGWTTVCAVEIEDYPRRVLLARQRDGILPRFPIWDDVTIPHYARLLKVYTTSVLKVPSSLNLIRLHVPSGVSPTMSNFTGLGVLSWSAIRPPAGFEVSPSSVVCSVSVRLPSNIKSISSPSRTIFSSTLLMVDSSISFRSLFSLIFPLGEPGKSCGTL